MKKLLIFTLLASFILATLSTFAFYFTLKPFLPFRPYLGYLLGKNTPTKYLILLQNDTELRPNGGFAGSYATATLDSTHSLIPKITVDFQDIYVPTGQIKDHITPPGPIDQAFKHGTWLLPNADWEPDFPTSATTIRWFFDKAGVGQFDVLVTLPLTVIKQIVQIIGPFTVQPYNATLTPDNLYAFLQNQAETNFFPGSTQKKDALHATGVSLIKKAEHLNLFQYFQIAQLLHTQLTRQNILLHSTNPDFQNFLTLQNFSGSLSPGDSDTFSLVEANLGANKANCCIVRHTTHQITKTNNFYTHTLKLTLENRSTSQNPNPPFNFSGNYVSYLRLYIPKDAWGLSLDHHETTPSGIIVPQTATPSAAVKYGLQEIGFYHTTAAGTTSTVDLTYNLSTISSQFPYSLTILKQHGLITSPQTVIFPSKQFTTDLLQSQVFSL